MQERPTTMDDVRPEAAAPLGRLEELYVRFAPGGYRLALLLTGSPQAAEDLVHDAFVQIAGRLGQFRTGLAFDAYLRRTIVNLTKNRWRRAAVVRRHPEQETVPPAPVPSMEGMLVERDQIWVAVLSLPLRQRTAIVLRFYEDLPEVEIAAIMRCRPGTARSLISRGMARLREGLKGDADA